MWLTKQRVSVFDFRTLHMPSISPFKSSYMLRSNTRKPAAQLLIGWLSTVIYSKSSSSEM